MEKLKNLIINFNKISLECLKDFNFLIINVLMILSIVLTFLLPKTEYGLLYDNYRIYTNCESSWFSDENLCKPIQEDVNKRIELLNDKKCYMYYCYEKGFSDFTYLISLILSIISYLYTSKKLSSKRVEKKLSGFKNELIWIFIYILVTNLILIVLEKHLFFMTIVRLIIEYISIALIFNLIKRKR